MDIFDYIIVGAGSAGCVLAERLSADGRARVLVLEAGGSDRRAKIRVPIGYGMSFHDPRVNWRFQAGPDPELDNRRMYWPRGKVLGGSSAINAMVYARGLPGDFDDWEAAGNPGWGAATAAGVFNRIERRITPAGTEGEGPLHVSDRRAEYHPLGRHYLKAAQTLGLPEGDTVTGEGVGPYWTTTKGGRRHSAADAFLRPAMARRNLKVITGAEVLGLEFRDLRATGVRYRKGGETRRADCRGEVILSAGSVKSPQLLQLSGIGPGALLSRFGIEVRLDAPGVGGALQDHLSMTYSFRCTEPTLNQVLGGLPGQVGAALRYLLRRDGPLSLSVNQMGGLVRSRPGLARADTQLYCNPLSYSTVYRDRRPLLQPDRWPGFILGYNPCRPTSRGRIDIDSPDPTAQPAITPNSLSTNTDIADMIAGARLIERMLETSAMRGLIAGPNGFSPVGQSDDALLADIRARAATVYHPCGTCRMAPREAGGVVDPSLRVWGAEGLRVVDASIFPNITSANTNAPTIMAAMRAADLILAGT
ncbi:GMC family oxidoreductase N-terminal domain-containing protein [Roseibacterium sp. SDUM158016]|uniref:GMC family oxidoreductase n=1 Tax=Roseicyclus sediminis TaxID=2980997 RepID=UPI0021D0EFDA|nr:GMC family oxidoreductase N-terminal domain-containing protein [Roseibacterium sp. SDUM158016]MCU4651790.1 GMC family oxidoreductase N-terminal domain-containing protein [Roseibacterium sp. SDUM158016]